MIVDVHTHIMWYPDHISEQTAEEALASKLVKLKMSAGKVNQSSLDLHSYDSHPDQHWEASAPADKAIVFGMQARPTGFFVPNDIVADYVKAHPEKLEGWASINPAEPDALEELERCVHDLGLRGMKVGPVYQHWDPRDESHWPFFRKCAEYDLPIVIHQGTTFPTTAKLEWANPLQLEPLAMAIPELRMIVAHLGHPWETDLIALMRKAPNVYADISAVHYRPWRYWQAMISAMEYGVTHKFLLGSDFPSGTVMNVIDGLRAINDPVEGTQLPRFPTDLQDLIVEENWKSFFGPDYFS